MPLESQRQIDRRAVVGAPPGPRRVRLKVTGVVIGIAVLVSTSGCMFPSANFLPQYVANHDGRYYVGERCRPNLTDAMVTVGDAWASGSPTVDLSVASWRAMAGPAPVSEFELYAAAQPGVTLVVDDGTRPLTDTVHVYVRATGEQWRSLTLALGDLEVGSVASYAGRMTWEKFMAMPDRDFGC